MNTNYSTYDRASEVADVINKAHVSEDRVNTLAVAEAIDWAVLDVRDETGATPDIDFDGAWEYVLPHALDYIASDYGIPIAELYKIDYGTRTL